MSLKAIRRAVRREREERARLRAERQVMETKYRGAPALPAEEGAIAIESEPGPAKRGILSRLLGRLGRRA